MLLRRHSCQRLEPVRIMGGSLFDRPFLHLVSDHVRCCQIQLFSFFDGFLQISVYLFGQAFLHDSVIKNILAKDVRHVKCFTHILAFPFFLLVSSYIRKRHSNFRLERLYSLYLSAFYLGFSYRTKQFHFFFYFVNDCLCARFEKLTRVIALAFQVFSCFDIFTCSFCKY